MKKLKIYFPWLLLFSLSAMGAYRAYTIVSFGTAERIERFSFTHTGVSTCAITAQTGTWLSSISCSTAGVLNFVIPAGTFSSAPICACSAGPSAASDASTCVVSGATTTTLQITTSDGATRQPSSAQGFCMGPR